MNEATVDLTELKFITDGDTELEHELFEEFISSSKSLLNKMDMHCHNSNDNETWKEASHALKGISLNLGARTLSELSANGQNIYKEHINKKIELLNKIKTEHKKVIDFLKTQ